MAVSIDNKDIVARFFEEVLGQGHLERYDEYMAPDLVFRATHIPVQLDREGHKQFLLGLHGAFPDWRESIVTMVAEGDQVVTHLRGTGTHRGELLGIPATGATVTFDSVNIDRVEDGLIRQRWLMADGLSLLQQLGVVPPLGATA